MKKTEENKKMRKKRGAGSKITCQKGKIVTEEDGDPNNIRVVWKDGARTPTHLLGVTHIGP